MAEIDGLQYVWQVKWPTTDGSDDALYDKPGDAARMAYRKACSLEPTFEDAEKLTAHLVENDKLEVISPFSKDIVVTTRLRRIW